jgi:hypothetical protein
MEDLGRVQNRTDSVARRLWLLIWPLTFVAVMTILSECGPQTSYSKSRDGAASVVSQPSARWIK